MAPRAAARGAGPDGGDFPAAISATEEGVELALRGQDPTARLLSLGFRLEIARYTAYPVPLEGLLDEMVDLAAPRNPPIGLALLAVHRAQRGDLSAARQLMEQTAAQLTTMPRDVRWFPTVIATGHTSALLGNSTIAGWCYDALRPYASRYLISGSGVWGSASYFLGTLAATVGNIDGAVRHLDEAARREAAIGAVVHHARTELACADLLIRRGASGDLGRAERLATRTRQAAERYRMTYLAAEALAIRDTPSGKVREPAAALTAREREIVVPLETTSVLPRACGSFVSSSRRRYSDTQTTVDARETTTRVAAATPGIAPMLRTSRPCAVTTSGARVPTAAMKPVGTRKCA